MNRSKLVRTAALLCALWLEICAVPALAAVQIVEAVLTWENSGEAYFCTAYERGGKYTFFLPAFAEAGEAVLTVRYEKGAEDVIPVALAPGETVTVSCRAGERVFATARGENLPALMIDIAEAGGIKKLHANKNNALPGAACLIGPDGEVLWKGGLERIRGRGNMSWDLPKKGYGIKLSEGADLLGMGKDKQWVLIPDYRDNSLLNFRIVNDLSAAMAIPFAQQSRWVELYLDGDYRGVYLLTEKMEIDKQRIDITDLQKATEAVNDAPLDTFKRKKITTNIRLGTTGRAWEIPADPEDITGGYLLELDTAEKAGEEKSVFTGGSGLVLSVKSPEYASFAQLNYIAAFWQDMEDALYSKTGYNKKGKHFSEYMDLESFACLWLLDEFGMEVDLCSSHYFYKDSDSAGDGKLHACAPWDVEHCFKREKYKYDYISNNGAPKRFWQNMYNLHPEFREEVARVWREKLAPALKKLLDPENDTALYEGVCAYDTYTAYISASAAMNHARWPSALATQTDDRACRTWEQELTYVYRYLAGRTEYLDSVYGAAE